MEATRSPLSSLAFRVAVVGSLGLAVVMTIFMAATSLVATEHNRSQILGWVGDKVDTASDMIDTFDATGRESAGRLHSVFKAGFPEKFSLDDSTGNLSHGGKLVNGQYAEVDRFTQVAGGVATVFARKDDDFIRVTTSLKKENGERAIGTLLGKQHPAYALMLEGKSYVGRAELFGRHYMTKYEAIQDAGGKVIGILFIGLDITDFMNSLAKSITGRKIFETGGVYALDVRPGAGMGTFAVHARYTGRKLVDQFPGSEGFLKEVTEARSGVVRASPATLADTGTGDRYAVVKHNAAWGWVLVAELSEAESMSAHWATQRTTALMILGAAALLAVALFAMITRMVVHPLRRLGGFVGSASQTKLGGAGESARNDEIGILARSVESRRKTLVGMIGAVRSATYIVSTASVQIAARTQDLAARTEQQASSLEETASSMEELTSTVLQNAESAKQANQLAAGASDVAVKGGQVIGQVVQTMSTINDSSKRITDIISVIDGISFQTNILALNAAVEAARAGEQGRGFAVVAAEVRMLAQRSAEAAKEIKQLIEDSVNKVEDGTKLVDEAGKTMEQIVASVKRVTDIMSEIAAASQQQRSGIEEVNQAITQMDQVTQQNAALVEETNAAAESLKQQAQQLVQAVAVFKQTDGPARPAAGAEAGQEAPRPEKAAAPGSQAPGAGAPAAPRERRLRVVPEPRRAIAAHRSARPAKPVAGQWTDL